MDRHSEEISVTIYLLLNSFLLDQYRLAKTYLVTVSFFFSSTAGLGANSVFGSRSNSMAEKTPVPLNESVCPSPYLTRSIPDLMDQKITMVGAASSCVVVWREETKLGLLEGANPLTAVARMKKRVRKDFIMTFASRKQDFVEDNEQTTSQQQEMDEVSFLMQLISELLAPRQRPWISKSTCEATPISKLILISIKLTSKIIKTYSEPG